MSYDGTQGYPGDGDDPEYLAWVEVMERTCNAEYITGPRHDPYSAGCDLEAGHHGPHAGDDPMGSSAWVSWTGGGMCAGDRLPAKATWHQGSEARPADVEAADELCSADRRRKAPAYWVRGYFVTWNGGASVLWKDPLVLVMP